ncbi:MAG: caspase family protein [Saprospiraceae bacterium]
MAIEGFTNGYALIIGVGGDLPDTITDAQKVYDTIIDKEKAGYQADNCVLLLAEKAKRTNVLAAIEGLKNKIVQDDNQQATVMVYYSGHGGFDKRAADKPFYFLTNGYDTANFATTCIAGEEFSQLLDQVPAKKLIVLLDCCYAGQLKSKAGREDEEDPANFHTHLQQDNQMMVNSLDQGSGRIIIASSTADQVSFIGNQGLSIFTEVLVEALSGKNTRKEEAYVSFSDLWGHLGKEVSKRAQQQNQKPQDPVINAKDATFFYLCQNRMETIVTIPKVFILNAPKDDSYLQGLNKQLAGMARRGKIAHWDPSQIIAGNSISATLDQELKEAQIVVLLVSADYLASDRCYDIQEKAIHLGKTILPVIVRHCLYEEDDYINDQPKLPMQDGELVPVSAWSSTDEALAQVAGYIRARAKELSER